MTEAIYQAYVPGQSNYGAEIAALQAADIAVVFIGGYHTEIALMARAAADRSYAVQLVAAVGLGTEEFGLIAGPAAEGTLFLDVADPRRRPGAAPVVERFRAAGFDPEGYTLYAYGAVQVWAQAAEVAGSLDLQTVITALREHQFDTVLGPIAFDAKGDLIEQNPYVCLAWRHLHAVGARLGHQLGRRHGATSCKKTVELGRREQPEGNATCGRLISSAPGLRWRLLLAFFGISAFAVIAAAAAMYSFAEVGQLLERITQTRVPSALASLELSRQAERVVSAAPALLAATTREQHEEVSQAIDAEVDHLGALLGDLKGSGIGLGALAAVEPAIDGLERNLAALDALVARRLEISERKAELLRKLSGTHIAAQRLVAPGVLVMDSSSPSGAGQKTRRGRRDRGPATRQLADEMTLFMPQQKAQIEISAINDSLTKAADAESAADLPLLAFPLRRSLTTLETLASEFEAKLRPRLMERVEELRGFIDGPESILAAREQELAIVARRRACSPRTPRFRARSVMASTGWWPP